MMLFFVFPEHFWGSSGEAFGVLSCGNEMASEVVVHFAMIEPAAGRVYRARGFGW